MPVTLEEFGLSGFIHTEDGAIAIGEPHVAATWFPANDHPRDKATFTIAVTLPAGLEGMSNGVLDSHTTKGDWTTWKWDAREPMATYLAFIAVGQFDIRSYKQDGIKYWDAIDSAFMGDQAPADHARGWRCVPLLAGRRWAYKRLTHVIDVPAGGADVSFRANRDTESGWDHLFVEVHTVGHDDWTTLPDVNGHTTQDVGACPGFRDSQSVRLSTTCPPSSSTRATRTTRTTTSCGCDPVGTTGEWNAISGLSDGWEDWHVDVPDAGGAPRQVELSITYESDGSVQGRGVVLDSVVVSTGQGTTSFEADGNQLDGWVAPIDRPDTVAGDREQSRTTRIPGSPRTSCPPVPGLGDSALDVLRPSAGDPRLRGRRTSGRTRSRRRAASSTTRSWASRSRTRRARPTRRSSSAAAEGNDFVVVHELAHMWYGDSIAVNSWQDIWLNEGFATYAEWLWSEREGFGTAQENFDGLYSIPEDEEEVVLVSWRSATRGRSSCSTSRSTAAAR